MWNQIGRTRWGGAWRRATAGTVAVGVILLLGSCSSSEGAVESAQEQTTAVPTTTTEPSPPSTTTPATEAGETADMLGDEFVELVYFEVPVPGSLSLSQQPDDECDRSEPEIVVCSYEQTVTLRANVFGEVDEVLTGTATTYLSESCTDPSGETVTRTVRKGEGTMTTTWGDELYFRIESDTCTRLPGVTFWEFAGGTGRFVDAHGIISTLIPGEALPATTAVNAGTLQVRADLWEPVLPPVD